MHSVHAQLIYVSQDSRLDRLAISAFLLLLVKACSAQLRSPAACRTPNPHSPAWRRWRRPSQQAALAAFQLARPLTHQVQVSLSFCARRSACRRASGARGSSGPAVSRPSRAAMVSFKELQEDREARPLDLGKEVERLRLEVQLAQAGLLAGDVDMPGGPP